jgi:hypothetical protein
VAGNPSSSHGASDDPVSDPVSSLVSDPVSDPVSSPVSDPVSTRADAAPGPPAFELDLDFAFRSDLDRALTWYRDELALRRLVGILALPTLLALTGLGLLTDPGAVTWLVAVLAFLAAAEIAWTTTRLRRER